MIPRNFATMFSNDSRVKIKFYLTLYHVVKQYHSFKHLKEDPVCLRDGDTCTETSLRENSPRGLQRPPRACVTTCKALLSTLTTLTSAKLCFNTALKSAFNFVEDRHHSNSTRWRVNLVSSWTTMNMSLRYSYHVLGLPLTWSPDSS